MPSVKKAGKSESSIAWLIIAIVFVSVFSVAGFQISQALKNTAPEVMPSPSPTVSQDVDGIYKGDLPCADCSGITETLILAKDGSYILEDLYQEKSVKPFRTQGKWEKANNDILKLTAAETADQSYFQIQANGNLQMLDDSMQKIDSPFNQVLTKQS